MTWSPGPARSTHGRKRSIRSTLTRCAAAELDGDLARIARRLTGRSVGLVLSGGGARGFAHIGVLEELVEAGVVVDRIAAVSMGA